MEANSPSPYKKANEFTLQEFEDMVKLIQEVNSRPQRIYPLIYHTLGKICPVCNGPCKSQLPSKIKYKL